MSFERGLNQKDKDSLKLGSIFEIWREKHLWDKYTEYLNTMSEGSDSNGDPLSLKRYATFLEFYVKLHQLGIYSAMNSKMFNLT